jgi:hypothetical protein
MSEKREPHIIPKSIYLQAHALFVMANRHYKKAREFELELGALLGFEAEYFGHLSDEMSDGGDFDRAMKLEGFVVREPKPVRKIKKHDRRHHSAKDRPT